MHIYSLSAYGEMMRDRVRMTAYQQALAQAVKPGATVVDIGAGAGILSLHACRLGARLVHAIEPNDVIQVAREVAQANGFADRIVFHQKLSTEVELPELADVVVTDPRGILPLFEHCIPTILDARRRLLKPGGTLIPERDTLWAAPVEAPEAYAGYDAAWRTANDGFDFEAARRRVVNSFGKQQLAAGQLLAAPAHWTTLDYRTVNTASAAGELRFELNRAGLLHGFAVWFDAVLGPGTGFSNAPGQSQLIYGQQFFPLEGPFQVAPGQRLVLDLRADLVGDGYVWSWKTNVLDADDKIQVQYQQSTLRGAVLGFEQLRKRTDQFIPKLNPEGRVQQRLFELMAEGISLEQIASRLATEFPRRFSSVDEALGFAGEYSARYSD